VRVGPGAPLVGCLALHPSGRAPGSVRHPLRPPASQFHSVGYLDANLFAVLVWHWIGREVSLAHDRQPGRVLAALEWMGAWSYSLYLVHVPARAAWQMMAVPDAGSTLNWLLLVTFTLVVSYAFYRVVEHPSHLLARWFARLSARSSNVMPLVAGSEAADTLGRPRSA
jgi:peptidoglycan/LPS O-acetylase OafA/YrhL